MSRRRKPGRQMPGVLPRLIRRMIDGGAWLLRHPHSAIAGALLMASGWALWTYAQRADAFRVTRVEMPQDPTFTLRDSVVGDNIWKVDLGLMAERLKQQQPWLKNVRVIRQLPDTIRVSAIQRQPVAQVRIDRWYPVDREGFVLPQGTTLPDERLIQLTVDRSRSALRAGAETPDERLLAALRILSQLRRSPALASRRVTEINVSDAQSVRFVLDGETEIRCGAEEELDAQMGRLQATLRAVAKQDLAVRYIDLRFQDPVVGTRASAAL